MSLVGLALRISAVRALVAAQTIAGERVFDSAILPIDKLAGDTPEPFIQISTETEILKPSGRDLKNGSGSITLLVEIAMSRVSVLPDGAGIEYEIFESDANLELGLAILKRQILACLFERGGGVWGDVFRRFATAISEVHSFRAGQAVEGARFAGRQIVFTIASVAEPGFGPQPEGTPWAAFLDALSADAALSSLAPIIRGAIENTPVDWPAAYSKAALAGGYTDAEGEAIGITEFAPGINAVDVVPDGWNLVDEIGEALPPEAAP